MFTRETANPVSVNASVWPCTRAEYFQYRGWDVPKMEAAIDEAGWLIEYPADGHPNHPNHKGPISWLAAGYTYGHEEF